MIRLILLLVSLLFVPELIKADEVLSFPHKGIQRSFLIHVPDNIKPQQTPLLLVLHGRTGTGKRMARISEFNQRADQHGFIAVYPDGLNKQWNYLYGVPGARQGADDPGFLTALTHHISRAYDIDPARRYVTGLSNGGFMAQRLVCDTNNLFSGFASVGASAYAVMPDNCQRKSPVDALYIHGTADKLVPWQGLVVKSQDGSEQTVTLSIKRSLTYWSNHNSCGANVDVKDLLPGAETPDTHVRLFSATDCVVNSAVNLYAIIGGGHNWPGVSSIIPPAIAGRVNTDIHASDEIWSFFTR